MLALSYGGFDFLTNTLIHSIDKVVYFKVGPVGAFSPVAELGKGDEGVTIS